MPALPVRRSSSDHGPAGREPVRTIGHLRLPYRQESSATAGQPPRVSVVVPVGMLVGRNDVLHRDKPSWSDLAVAVVQSAEGVGAAQGRDTAVDSPCECRFPIDPVVPIFRLKLTALAESWQAAAEYPDDATAVVRITAAFGWFARLKGHTGGVELVIRTEPGSGPAATAHVVAGVYGRPTRKYRETAARVLPRIVRDARSALEVRSDRRTSERVSARIPVWVFPVSFDGRIHPPVEGNSLNVSAGGVGFTTDEPLPTDFAYLVIGDEPAGHSNWAILTHLVRVETTDGGHRVGGRYVTWG